MRKIICICLIINFAFLIFSILISKGEFLAAALILLVAVPWFYIVPVYFMNKVNVLNDLSLKIYSMISGAQILLLMLISPIQVKQIAVSEVGVIVLLFLLVFLASLVSAFATYYFASEYMKRSDKRIP